MSDEKKVIIKTIKNDISFLFVTCSKNIPDNEFNILCEFLSKQKATFIITTDQSMNIQTMTEESMNRLGWYRK